MNAPHLSTAAAGQAPLRFAEFVALAATLMALTAIGIDSMLPALPAIGTSLGVESANHRQFVITEGEEKVRISRTGQAGPMFMAMPQGMSVNGSPPPTVAAIRTLSARRCSRTRHRCTSTSTTAASRGGRRLGGACGSSTCCRSSRGSRAGSTRTRASSSAATSWRCSTGLVSSIAALLLDAIESGRTVPL